ncbi:MAG: hypothetical protein WC789_10450 [Lentisphaeria bacterium]
MQDGTGTQAMALADDRPQMGMVAVSADQYGHIEALVRSEIQARTAVALARPRDLLGVRDRLLRDAARPGFAMSAEYGADGKFRRGGKMITGPSIRFAEAALRAMGNMVAQEQTIHDSDTEQTVRVSVADLETNTVVAQEVTYSKTVERRSVNSDDHDRILGQRTNSEGKTLYIVQASEVDLFAKRGALVARARRNLILNMLPGDIKDDAIAECRETRKKADRADPGGAAKKVADAFSVQCNVRPDDLAKYLGHPVDQCSPAELDELRGVFAAIRDGQTTWPEVMGNKDADEKKAADPLATARKAVADKVQGRGTKTAATPIQPHAEVVTASASDILRERWVKAAKMDRNDAIRWAAETCGVPADDEAIKAFWASEFTDAEQKALEAKLAEVATAGE